MASYTDSYGKSFSIIDNGIYDVAGDPNLLLVRNGNNATRIYKSTLQQFMPSWQSSGTVSLPQLADTEAVFGRTSGLSNNTGGQSIGDFVKGAMGLTGGSNYSAKIDPNNPNGSIVSDSQGQVISQKNPTPSPGALDPSTLSSLANPNVTSLTGVQGAPPGTAPSNNTPTSQLYPANQTNADYVPPATSSSGVPSPFGSNFGPLGVPTVPNYTPPSSINSGSMGNGTSGQTTTYNVPQPNTGSAKAALDALYAQYQQSINQPLGPQDTKESDLVKAIQDLNTQEAGKADYQNQQNNAQGVTEKQNTVNDLQAQLQQILNEHAAAQMQTQQGQGVTTAIDSRQRDEETRQNAIKALSIQSLIAAANSNLVNAQNLANKAVALKFDPIEAQIKASTDNLKLIQNDPKTTEEEKARASYQQAVLSQYQDQVSQAKTDQQNILNIAQDAASKGATSVQLQSIMASTSPAMALQVASVFNLNTSAPKILGSATTGYFTYDSSTGQLAPLHNSSGGSAPTPSSPTSQGSTPPSSRSYNADVQSAISQFQQIKTKNGWRGVNPDDYQAMVDYLQKTYGTQAVSALKSAMSAVGLIIDQGSSSDSKFGGTKATFQ
jgi:hypothetical protein